MTPSAPDTLPPFADPTLEARAQGKLNEVVLALLHRMTQPEGQRPAGLGKLQVIEDAPLADEVFKSPAVFEKNFALVAALGESRFNLNGERWAQFRDRTQPAYNKASKPGEMPDIAQIYREALDDAPISTGDGVETALTRAALAVVCKALGIAPDPEAIMQLFPFIRTHAKLLQFFSWYGTEQPDVLIARSKWLERRFTDIVTANPETAAFIADSAARGTDTDASSAISDLMQNLFAGVETTVATLGWAVWLLGRNQTLQDALYAEASALVRNRPLTRGFLWEAMRCFPPIPFVVRQLSSDYESHGRRFAKNDQVIVSILGLHRNPLHWDRPHGFHAARAEFAEGQPVPLAFRPFLSGPRVCGGKRLAELEMLSALPLIVQRWRITTAEADIRYDYALALRPAGLASVSLEARRG